MKSLTPRERVRKALNHEEPDQVPIDLGGFVCGIHEKAYRDLASYLNMEVEISIYDYMQRLALVDERILRMFNVDTRYIYAKPSSNWKFKEDPDQSWVDEWGVRRKRCGYYSDVIYSPLSKADISDIERYPFPDPCDPARFEELREEAKRLYEETDYALIVANSGSIQYLPSELKGWEQYLTDLALNQDIIIKLTDRFLDWNIKYFDKLLDACGEYIEMVWIGDDWGHQNGPVIRPEVFRKIFKPRMKELVDFIKNKVKVKVALHSCGSVYWAIQDFIDVGIDVLNPVQVSAKDMDTKRLKEEFGDKLVFWGGGCDTQKVLPFGNPEEVRKEVKKRIKDLAPGGGFVFTPVHNIQASVPPENIISMYKAVEEYGRYPIAI